MTGYTNSSGKGRQKMGRTGTYHSFFTVLILSMSFILVFPLVTKRKLFKAKIKQNAYHTLPPFVAEALFIFFPVLIIYLTRNLNLPPTKSPDGSLFSCSF